MKRLYSLLGIIISLMIFIIPADAQTDVPRYNYITIRGGDTIRTICTQDGIADEIPFRHESYHYQVALVITNEQDSIEAINIRSKFDFEGATAGICRVYSVSYIGILTAEVGESLDSIGVQGTLIGISRNFVEINRVHTIGAEVYESSGLSDVTLCTGDGNPDVVEVKNTSPDGNKYVYIVTDENNTILQFTTDTFVSFEETLPGVCYIYGASYSGNLALIEGTNVNSAVVSDQCYERSSNFITVSRIESSSLDPLQIQSEHGDSIRVCAGDGVADVISWDSNFSTQLPNHTYVITDADLNVIDLTDSTEIDFESVDGGICKVWALSYSGSLIVKSGDNIGSDLLADHCYIISENSLTITRDQVFPTTITSSLGREFQVCTSDGLSDSVDLIVEGGIGNYAFLLTREDGVIFHITEDTLYDFNAITEDVVLVYGISYSDSIPVAVGDSINNLSDGCYLVSTNNIRVLQASAEGGIISTTGGDSILLCAGNNVSLELTTNSNEFEKYYYVLLVGDSIVQELESPVENSALPVGQFEILGIAYAIIKPFSAGNILDFNLEGCFSPSENRIYVTKKEVTAPVVISPQGSVVNYCVGDGMADTLSLLVSNESDGYKTIITNSELVVLAISDTTLIDFEGSEEGKCLVWGLNFTGVLTLLEGDTIAGQNLSTECFRLSESSIEVNRIQPDGGTVSSSLGDVITFCPDESSNLEFDYNTNSKADYKFMVINENGKIVQIFDNTLNTDSLGLGSFEVIGISYYVDFVYQIGDSVSSISEGCFDLSTNSIAINKVNIENPEITTEFGDSIELCVGDGKADLVAFDFDETATLQIGIITDDSLNVLMLTTDSVVDFDQAGFGTCLIWALNYTGELTFKEGDNLFILEDLSTNCNFISENPITVIRSGLESTLITSSVGDSIFLCAGESTINNIQFGHDSSSMVDEEELFIMVNSVDEVLGTSLNGLFDVDIEVQGEVKIWQSYYRGQPSIVKGDTLGNSEISSDCASLSTNYISIFFSDPSLVDGGMIISSLGDSVEMCVGDGENDFIRFSHSTSSNSLYSYLVTEPGGKIIAVTQDTLLNFEGVTPGECWVYGISHTVPVAQLQGRTLAEIFAEGCFSLSENRIVLLRSKVEQQSISALSDTLSVFDICIGDGADDWISFTSGEPGQSKQLLVITDEESIIQAISDSLSYNFENSPGGTSWVWAVNYGGDILLEPGDTLFGRSISSLCSALTSNFITINKTGLISSKIFDVTGDSTYNACVGNNVSDFVNLVSDVGDDADFRFVVFSEDSIVQAIQVGATFDFDQAGVGVCFIKGLSFGGELLLGVGDTLSEMVSVSSSCWAWSSNEFIVNRSTIDPGTIGTKREANSITLCNQNETPDVIHFTHDEVDPGLNYAYIITDAIEDIISVVPGDSMDFNDAPEGLCLVYGIAYEGELDIVPGTSILTADLASGCFRITNNSIEIVRSMPDGGTISLLGGQDSISFCVSDENADRAIFVESSFSLAKYRYILTDTNNVILEFLNIPAGVFTTSAPGICRVWGLSYTGNLQDSLLGEIDTLILSDDCFDLSENFITIIKEDDGPTCGNGFLDIESELVANLYPTLVHEEINIVVDAKSLHNNDKAINIQIFDLFGVLITKNQYKIDPKSNFQQKIDVRNLTPGSYIVMIHLKNRIKSFKFIK